MTSKTKTNLETSSLRIGGMTCVSCQNRIEKKLKSTAGVEAAAVDYNTGTAAVTWNPSAVTLDLYQRVVTLLLPIVIAAVAGFGRAVVAPRQNHERQ